MLAEFGLEPGRCRVLRNAAGPPFARLFSDAREAARAKTWPPVLAYTSTPFRGLDLLLDIFPVVRQAIPGTQLEVFSSMQVYRLSAADDMAQYGPLYRRCLETDGVEYIGSLPQPELAAALTPATLLAYPNHFADTSCIAVMEALAAGLRVVTSDLGALPETAAGLASLVRVDGDWTAYRERFAREVIRVLELIRAEPAAAEAHLASQLELVRREYNWAHRAREWEAWLSKLYRSTSAGSGKRESQPIKIRNMIWPFCIALAAPTNRRSGRGQTVFGRQADSPVARAGTDTGPACDWRPSS